MQIQVILDSWLYNAMRVDCDGDVAVGVTLIGLGYYQLYESSDG